MCLGLGDDAAIDRAGSFESQNLVSAHDMTRALLEVLKRCRLPLKRVGLLRDSARHDTDCHLATPSLFAVVPASVSIDAI